MIASMETYLRRGRRTCQRLLLNPKIRTGGVVLLCGGSGFLLSAASLGNCPQPLAMGLILAMSGWHGHESRGHAGLLGLLGHRGIAGAGVVGLRRTAGAAPCPAHSGGTATDLPCHFRVSDGADRTAVPAGAAGYRAGAGLFPADCPRRRGGTAVPRGAAQTHRRHRLAGGRRGGAGAGAGFTDALSWIGVSRGRRAGSWQRFPRRGAWRVGAGSGAGDEHSHDGGTVSRGRDPHDPL